MKLTRQDLGDAVAQDILSAPQAERLWAFLADRGHDTASFRTTHILYYLGGLLAIGAMTLFMNLGWEQFGGWGLFFIALGYAGVGLWLTEYFLGKQRLAVPAGITATFAVALVPLAVYGLQQALGFWPEDTGGAYRDYHFEIDWRWMLMELATLAAGTALAWRYRLPFMLMPIAVTLWYMSMDLTPFLFGDDDLSWDLRRYVSILFGTVMVLIAFWVDMRTRSQKDYAFWLYLFGVLAFWGALSSFDSDDELGKFVYFCINLGMVVIGTILSRRVFVIFGAIGMAFYVGHLAHTVFRDSLLFPLALTVIGLGVIGLGVVWQRNEAAIGAAMRRWLPTTLRELIEKRA